MRGPVTVVHAATLGGPALLMPAGAQLDPNLEDSRLAETAQLKAGAEGRPQLERGLDLRVRLESALRAGRVIAVDFLEPARSSHSVAICHSVATCRSAASRALAPPSRRFPATIERVGSSAA
jgi:hypothetical protein